MKYGYTRTVELPMDAAIEKVTATLADNGFGVLTTIDVKATIKKKLDIDRRPYVILGACNPSFAHQALEFEEPLGLLLPCNVVVYEDASGATVIAAIDAKAMMSVVGNPALEGVAAQVNPLLQAAIDAV
jgi:uncharacterized protein (DUF302 family)